MIGADLIQPLVDATPWLILAKVSALLFLLLVLSRASRRYATLQYKVWFVGLVAICALPALSNAPWRLAVLPVTVPAQPNTGAIDTQSRPRPPDNVATSTVAADRHSAPATSSNKAEIQDFTRRSTAAGKTFSAIWVLGAAFVLGRFLVGIALLTAVSRRSTPDPRAQALLDQLRAEKLHDRPIRVLVGSYVQTPMTWGLRHAIILLPAGARVWSEERLRAVLLHELAHVQRYDIVGLFVSRLACAIYWFHPLAWIGARQMSLAAEHACDHAVTAAGIPARRYAQHVVDIARAQAQPAGFLRLADRSQLKERIYRILSRELAIASRLRVSIALLLVAAATTTVAALSPQQASTRIDAEVAAIAGRLDTALASDSQEEKYRLLIDVLAESTLDTRHSPPFFAATNSLHSDRHRARVLCRLAKQEVLEEPLQHQLLGSVVYMQSDRDAADVLAAFANSHGVDQSLESAFRAALESVSDERHHHRILQAAGMNDGAPDPFCPLSVGLATLAAEQDGD